MTMTPLERKAAFLYAVTMNKTTLEAGAQDGCDVTWFHLSQGIAGERKLGAEVKQKFAAYIDRSVEDVFGEQAHSESAA
jgi:hypothetical protein